MATEEILDLRSLISDWRLRLLWSFILSTLFSYAENLNF